MKKRLLSVALALVAVILTVVPVLAYLFTAPVTVTETNGTAYPMLAMSTAVDTAWLVAQGYIDADGRDTDITPTRHHMLTDTDLWLTTPLTAYGQVNLNLTTGNTSADMDIITGYNGFITTLDDADLELGNKFSIEQDGWVNTAAGATKNLVYKAGAFQTYVSAANTITSYFVNNVATNGTLVPDGVGTESNTGVLFGAATRWQANLTNDGDTSYVQGNNAGAYQRDLYACQDSGISAGTINSVIVYMVCKGNGDFAKTALRTNGVTFDGVQTALGAGYVTYSTTYALNPQSGVAWTWAEIDAMEIGVSLWLQATAPRSTQVYAVVNYYPAYVNTITPVASGEYTVRSYCDGAWFMLSLDGDTSWDGIHSDRVATGGAIVLLNANNWLIDQTNVMPYMTYYKHYVDVGAGLVLIAWYQPEDIIVDATGVLPDRQGAAEDGTITWGANPAGTAMVIASFSGYGGTFADVADDTPLDRLAEVPVSDWYGDHTVTKAATIANPIRPMVLLVSDNTTMTEIQVWRWYGMILLVGVFAIIARYARGHQGITFIATGAIIAFLIAFDSSIFPIWLAVLSAGFMIGGLLSERSHQI